MLGAEGVSEHGGARLRTTDSSMQRAGLGPSGELADGEILLGSREMGVHCNNVKIRNVGKILYVAGCRK